MNKVLLGLVLLLSLSSAYAGSCYEGDVAVCKAEAEQGDVIAQIHLGQMYAKGQGVIKDYVMAYMYFNAAAGKSGRHDPAYRERDVMAERMTPSQIAEAHKLAREWMRNH